MKLIDLTCPNCSAQMKVNSDRGQVVCEHCGTTILMDDEVRHLVQETMITI